MLELVLTAIGSGSEGIVMSEELIQKAIAGERRALAKLLTACEKGEVTSQSLENYEIPIESVTIGVTGAPGVGKSSLIEALLAYWSQEQRMVAVIAVDPSSPITGGALLGDRVRMDTADDDDNVFVRSIASKNQPGGLPQAVAISADVLKLCGYNPVLIETVGAGQSEVRIVAMAERIVLVEAPNAGDEVQAAKAGVIELADLLVVNKADLDGAEQTATRLISSLSYSESPPEVLLTSTTTHQGIKKLGEVLVNLPQREGAEIARHRERLLAAWDQALLERPDLDDVLQALTSGEESASSWVGDTLGW